MVCPKAVRAIRAALRFTRRSRAQAPLCLDSTGPRQMPGRLNNAFRLPAARPSLRKPCPGKSTGAECSQSDDCRQGTPATVLGDRLMVGQVPFCRLRRAAIGGMRRGRQVERCCIGRSTNGRSSAFDALSPGSNPGRPAKSRRTVRGERTKSARVNCVRRQSADFGQASNLGFFGGSNMPRKLDGF